MIRQTVLAQLEERIREAAYFKWESEGRPNGRALDHWLAAEREMLATIASSQAPAESNFADLQAWRQFHGKPSNTGFSLVHSKIPLNPKWQLHVGKVITSSPVVGPDGTIYIGTADSAFGGGGEIVAVNPNGTVKWRRDNFGGPIVTTPVVSKSGNVYVTTSIDSGTPNLLYTGLISLDISGNTRWALKIEDGGGGTSSPKLFDMDNTLFLYRRLTDGGNIYAVDDSGHVIATYHIPPGGTTLTSESPIDFFGHIFGDIGDFFTTLYKTIINFPIQFDPSAAADFFPIAPEPTVAIVNFANVVPRPLIVFADGVNVIGALHWNNNSFAEVWDIRRDELIVSSPAVFPTGLLVFGKNSGSVAGYDVSSGHLLWETDVGSPVISTPASFIRQIVVLSARGVHLLDSNGDLISTLPLYSGTSIGEQIGSHPVFSGEGFIVGTSSPVMTADMIYLNLLNHGLLSLSFDLVLLGRAAISDSGGITSPAVGSDGTIYAVTGSRDLFAGSGDLFAFGGTFFPEQAIIPEGLEVKA